MGDNASPAPATAASALRRRCDARRHLSPTHPPCGLAFLLRGGRVGSPPWTATETAKVLWHRKIQQEKGKPAARELPHVRLHLRVPRGGPYPAPRAIPATTSASWPQVRRSSDYRRPPTPRGAEAPWPLVRPSRGQVSPTHPPCSLARLFGGRVGGNNRLSRNIGRQCALAPTEKGGSVGQSLERSIGRQRALAATGVPKTRSQLRPTNDLMSYRPPLAAHLGGQCIFLCVARASASAPGPPVYHSSGKAPPTRPSWCQRTLAVGAAPEACLSHPPALRLGSAFWGAGGWGSFSNAPLAASVRWQRDMGGWVGQFLERSANGQGALGATQAPTIRQRVRPTSAFGKRGASHILGGHWHWGQLLDQRHVAANVLSARVMTCPCQSALAAGAPPEGRASPTRPPCGLAPLLGEQAGLAHCA